MKTKQKSQTENKVGLFISVTIFKNITDYIVKSNTSLKNNIGNL